MLVALAGLVVVGAVPAVAESNTVAGQYVALGDSYAAGLGGGDLVDLSCFESETATLICSTPKRASISVTGYPYLFEQPATGDPNAVIINAVNGLYDF